MIRVITSGVGGVGADIGIECDKCGRHIRGLHEPFVETYKPTGFSFWDRVLGHVLHVRSVACEDGWEIIWWWEGDHKLHTDLCPACSRPWNPLEDSVPKLPGHGRR